MIIVKWSLKILMNLIMNQRMTNSWVFTEKIKIMIKKNLSTAFKLMKRVVSLLDLKSGSINNYKLRRMKIKPILILAKIHRLILRKCFIENKVNKKICREILLNIVIILEDLKQVLLLIFLWSLLRLIHIHSKIIKNNQVRTNKKWKYLNLAKKILKKR